MNLRNWIHKITAPKNKVEVIETEVPVQKLQIVEKEIPINKIEIVDNEIPIDRIVTVEKQIPVEKLTQVEVQVPVDRVVQVEKDVIVPKVTEVIREIPIDKVQIVNNDVVVEKVNTVDREIPITKIEVRDKEIPIDKVVTVDKEIPIDKVQIVEIDKPIFDTKTKNTLNTINEQIENVMGLRDLFKSKSNDFTEKYEILSKSIEDLERSVEQLNGVDFNTKIEVLYRKLDTVNEFLGKIKFRKHLESDNSQMNMEIQNLKDEIYTINLKHKDLQEEFERVKQERDQLLSRTGEIDSLQDSETMKIKYNQLLDFAFRNIDPFTQVDVQEARHYWENAIKRF